MSPAQKYPSHFSNTVQQTADTHSHMHTRTHSHAHTNTYKLHPPFQFLTNQCSVLANADKPNKILILFTVPLEFLI